MIRKPHVLVRAAALLTAAAMTGAVAGYAAAHGPHEGHEGHNASPASSFAAGEPGAAHAASRTVGIVMRDDGGGMVFQPSVLEVKQGEQVRFVLQNAGALDHEFLVDTVENNAAHKEAMAADPEMQHVEANGRRLKPGQTAELIWRFTKAGTFEIACLIPGHYESGMKGSVVVK